MSSPINTNSYSAHVHFWAPKSGPGHTSLSLVDEKGKTYHTGFWPTGVLGANLFTMTIPGNAEIMTDLAKEMIREGSGDKPLAPTRTYQIPLSKEAFEKARSTQDQIHSSVENKSTLYGLLPNTSFFSFFKSVGANLSVINTHTSCPMSDFPMEHEEAEKGIKSYTECKNVQNCSTATSEILRAAQVKVGSENSMRPWGISPLGVDGHLRQLAAEQPDKIKVIQHNDQ